MVEATEVILEASEALEEDMAFLKDIIGHIMVKQSTKLTCFLTNNNFCITLAIVLTYFNSQYNSIGKYSISGTNW